MTRSLLTPKDIKDFIYSAIQDVHSIRDIYYSVYQLSDALGISVYFIKKYTRQGMPCVRYLKTKRYNINKVIEWLNKNNIEFKLNNNV